MKSKNIIDDGFRADLVESAVFAGDLEIPTIRKPDHFLIPDGLIPFSARRRSKNNQEFVMFYEHDIRFAKVLTSTDEYLEELKMFPGVISPDCSLYRDMPLCLQIANTYMNRAVGHYLQEKGIYVIPNIRWGDERTYTTDVLPEKIAFLGVEKNSIVSVGTYGCIQGKQNKYHFTEGLRAMLDELEPEIVLVYGPMPASVFDNFSGRTQFIRYDDWTSLMKREAV